MLDHELINRTLSTAMRTGGEFAEVFVEDKRSSSAVLDDGRVEELTSGRDRGAGIRVVVGDTTGFAHTADLSEAGLSAAAEAAAAAARGGGGGAKVVAVSPIDVERSAPVRIPPEDVAKATKVGLLTLANEAARAQGSAISQVSARYGDSRRRILVANSDGVLAEDDQVRTSSRCRVSRAATPVCRPGESRPVARSASNCSMRRMSRRWGDAPPSVPSRSFPPARLHLARFPLWSALVAVACCSTKRVVTVSKPTWSARGRRSSRTGSASRSPPAGHAHRRRHHGRRVGPLRHRRRGPSCRHNVLIQDGVLTDYMWDQLRARKEGRLSSGNGRRQSYQHLPMVRMTNTYITAGHDDPEAIIADTDSGVYVAQLGGGQVNTATGDFVLRHDRGLPDRKRRDHRPDP